MSYTIVKQFQPPTGVEHCIEAKFLPSSPKFASTSTIEEENQLIVAKTSFLQIYRIKREAKGDVARLELAYEHKLFGNIESLNTIRAPGSDLDSLVLSFRDAKVSILDFDVASNEVKINSLHYHENEEYKDDHTTYQGLPQVRVDTKKRCGVMLVFDRRMVVIPFKSKTNVLDDIDIDNDFSSTPMKSFIIDLPSLGIKNVRDYVFLHGYYEPTLLILYEPTPTWTGRLAAAKDTCCITAISLALNQQLYPVIWTVEKLPYDCFSLLSVQEPLGGVVIFSTNQLLYLSQSNRFGLAMNEYGMADAATSVIPLVRSEVEITLENARALFLAPLRMLVSLRGGELYVFQIMSDGRTVQNFRITKAGASVLTCSLCTIGKNLLFLGSRLGDSMLIQFTEKISTEISDNNSDELEARPEKRMKLSFEDEPTNGGTEDKMLDEEEDKLNMILSSSKALSANQRISYAFNVCDSLLNFGPIADAIVSDSIDQATSGHLEFAQRKFMDFVTCSGNGKNGSLCIFQEGIRPEVITAFELAGCKAAWTLYYNPSKSTRMEIDETQEAEYHSFLLLAKEGNTMVLETGEALQEITDRVGFFVSGTTLDAGNVLNRQRIVQVYNSGIRLLNGTESVHEIQLEKEIRFSSITDPYILLQFSDGSIGIYRSQLNRLEEVTVKLTNGHGAVTACSLFFDENGVFAENSSNEKPQPGVKSETVVNQAPSSASADYDEMDEEERMLYGHSKAATPQVTKPLSQVTSVPVELKVAVKDTFLVLVRENGRLEIYNMKNMEAIYSYPQFPRGYSLVAHNQGHREKEKKDKEQTPASFFMTSEKLNSPDPITIEIGVHYLDNQMPYLVAMLNNGDLLVYKSFFYTSNSNQSLRFSRIEHEVVSRIPRRSIPTFQQTLEKYRYSRFKQFDNISDRRGLFIEGPRPLWLFCERSYLRFHHMLLDGEVTCFAPFHNINCTQGFIYITSQGILKICQLATLMNYENSWSVRKIPLRQTAYKICFLPDTRTFALAVSTKVPRSITVEYEENTVVEDEQGGRHERTTITQHSIPVAQTPIQPMDDKFEVRLMSPTWDIYDKLDLQPHEHVICMKMCNLKISQDENQKFRPYLVVGTGFQNGEDSTSRGRVILLDVIPVENQYKDPNSTEELKPKLKFVHAKEQKGNISVISTVDGYLLVAVGSKIILFNYTTNDLVGMAFYDATVYIVSVNVVKNYILCGDVYKSIFFLRWKEEGRQLNLLAKDFQPLTIFSTELLIYHQALAFLISDAMKNIQIFQYLPLSTESRGGQMLLPKADFHVGAHINKFVRLHLDPNGKPRSIIFYGTLDGGIGAVIPIDEVVFKRLLALQSRMVNSIQHFAGLNPKQFRSLKIERRLPRNPHGNILDGELLWRFGNLDFNEQKKLARLIGTTPEQIMENLMDIYVSSSFF